MRYHIAPYYAYIIWYYRIYRLVSWLYRGFPCTSSYFHSITYYIEIFEIIDCNWLRKKYLRGIGKFCSSLITCSPTKISGYFCRWWRIWVGGGRWCSRGFLHKDNECNTNKIHCMATFVYWRKNIGQIAPYFHLAKTHNVDHLGLIWSTKMS